MITTPAGPEFVKNDDQSGAKSGDHTQPKPRCPTWECVACVRVSAAAPSGVVTFLFTDIEESTRRWEANADAMRADLMAHDEVFALSD